ncbi:MarR family winged helix-turn-helix transcriptional regulator [Nocardia nova]|uniref:MarR family winged helix-turn-helix transcriptional regulator n=1 Tax=Nocardia nova TaxID=37330 RepID=UPI0033F9E119
MSPNQSADRGDDAVPTTSQLVDALQRAVGFVRTHFAAATASVGVTPVQAKALRQLSRPMTLKDLSAQLGADVSNTSSTVDRLEALGLVRKEPHHNDRRARVVTLTADGERTRARLEEAAFSTVPALDVLSREQQQELYRLLLLVGRPSNTPAARNDSAEAPLP